MEEISRIFENKSGEISPNFLLKGGVINYNFAVVLFRRWTITLIVVRTLQVLISMVVALPNLEHRLKAN